MIPFTCATLTKSFIFLIYKMEIKITALSYSQNPLRSKMKSNNVLT